MRKYMTPGILVSALLLIAGLVAWGATQVVGQKLFGATNAVPWNILLSNYAFLALAASGLCLTVAISSITGNEPLKRVAPLALVLSIASLLGGMMNTFSELGNPLRIIYVILSPNWSSPISLIFFVYMLYLPLLCVELWMLLKNRQEYKSLVTGLALVIGLTAPTVLGTIFAQSSGRPLLAGFAMSVYYLLTAMPAGLALLMLALMLIRGTGAESMESVKAAGRWLAMTLPFLLAALIWKAATLPAGSLESIATFADGFLGRSFWGLAPAIAIGLPFLLLLSKYGERTGILAASAAFILGGSFIARHTELIVGQLVPASPLIKSGSYLPSTADVVIVLGWLGLAALLFQVGIRALGLEQAPAAGSRKAA